MDSVFSPLAQARKAPSTEAVRAADLLHQARTHERAGAVGAAMEAYRNAIDEARRNGQWAIEAEAWRRLAIQHHHRNERDDASAACDCSYALAIEHGDKPLAAEVLNTRGVFASELGDLDGAKAL